MAVKKETKEILQRRLESVNNVLGTQLELDYYPQMGGYILESKRDTCHQAYPYIIQAHRMTANEMQAYLIGIYNGVRASRDQIFKQQVIIDYF